MSTDGFSALAAVAGSAARGDADGVQASVRGALAAGCSQDEVRESLRMVHLFCGFPRALDALAAAAPELGVVPLRGAVPSRGAVPQRGAAAAAPSDDDAPLHRLFRERGRALFDRVYGPDAARVHERLVALDPELTAWVLEDAYGRVLARDVLTPAVRERLAVVFLAAQGLRNQLPGHVRGALRCGATADEVEASLAAAAAWVADCDLALARTALRRGLVGG